MYNDKSPGDDGLPKEFYETNKNIISPILKEALNFTFQQPCSQKRAIIKLICEKGDPKYFFKLETN